MIQKIDAYHTNLLQMKSILYPFIIIMLMLTLTSCKQRMAIDGTSSIPLLEGRILYLRVFKDGDLQALDSAQIVHGKFQFKGASIDSTMMAYLFLGDESLMPVVIEGTRPLQVTISENERKVEGTALNDSLYAFIKRKSVVDNLLAELPHRESQMILEGKDHDEILMQLNQEARILQTQEDEMVMRFIKDNMDNILAPGIFMVVTSNVPPMLTPQIEELITLASPQFLSDAYVQEFMRIARENMEKINK